MTPVALTRTAPRNRVYCRLSLLCAAILIGVGVYIPFFPVWLASQSLSEVDIGLILAAPSLIRLFVNPPIAALADKHRAVPLALALCASATCLFFMLLGFTSGFWPIFIGVSLIACAQGPILPLSDTLIFAHIQRERAQHLGENLDYASIRAWGSASVFLGMVLAGPAVGLATNAGIVWILTGLAAIAAFATTLMAFATRHDHLAAAPVTVAAGTLQKPATLWLPITIIVAASLIQGSHGQLYAFATLDWQQQGLSDGFIGIVWSAGVLSETLFFLLVNRLFGGEARAMTFLVLGGVAAVLRWCAMLLVPDATALLVLNLLHGLTFGATHLGSVTLLATITQPQHRAQAQAWLASAVSVSLFAVMAASGSLHQALGMGSYAIMVAIALAGLATATAASAFYRRAS